MLMSVINQLLFMLHHLCYFYMYAMKFLTFKENTHRIFTQNMIMTWNEIQVIIIKVKIVLSFYKSLNINVF